MSSEHATWIIVGKIYICTLTISHRKSKRFNVERKVDEEIARFSDSSRKLWFVTNDLSKACTFLKIKPRKYILEKYFIFYLGNYFYCTNCILRNIISKVRQKFLHTEITPLIHYTLYNNFDIGRWLINSY